MKKLLGMLMVASVMALSGVAFSETKAADGKSADATKARIEPVGKLVKQEKPVQEHLLLLQRLQSPVKMFTLRLALCAIRAV